MHGPDDWAAGAEVMLEGALELPAEAPAEASVDTPAVLAPAAVGIMAVAKPDAIKAEIKAALAEETIVNDSVLSESDLVFLKNGK